MYRFSIFIIIISNINSPYFYILIHLYLDIGNLKYSFSSNILRFLIKYLYLIFCILHTFDLDYYLPIFNEK